MQWAVRSCTSRHTLRNLALVSNSRAGSVVATMLYIFLPSTLSIFQALLKRLSSAMQSHPKSLLVPGNGVQSCLGVADFRKDLHNFAFLGRSPRIGTASDWVWYNVPHGPQKQVESFFQGQRCIREGREQVCWQDNPQADWGASRHASQHSLFARVSCAVCDQSRVT